MSRWFGLASLLRSARRLGAGFLGQAAAASRPLVALAAGAAALLVAALALQALDPRQVLGASVWLKPAKFALAVATAALTMAWIVGELGAHRRGVRRAAWVLVATGALELTIITVQAARGVASHFNHQSLPDFVLFQIMGAGISVFWGAQVYLTWQAFRHGFGNAALAWGVRLGLVATLLGGAEGFLMPRPNPAQLARLRAGQPTAYIGSHSVGAEDGGAGLTLTRWNTQAGDLRVSHFLGLHGLQVLPLLGWALSRRRRPHAGRRLLLGAGIYLGVVIATLVQALHGRPLGAFDGVALAAGGLGFLAVLVIAGIAAALSSRSAPMAHSVSR